MIKLLLILFAFGGLLLLLLGFSVLRVLKWIFLGGSPSSQQKTQQKTKRAQTSSKQQQHTAPKRKKIIEKDEGEYIEFEEVKEFK